MESNNCECNFSSFVTDSQIGKFKHKLMQCDDCNQYFFMCLNSYNSVENYVDEVNNYIDDLLEEIKNLETQLKDK